MTVTNVKLPTAGGVLNVHSAGSATAASPLVCLHPAPHDGRFFGAALTRLARTRQVLAPDYPGYGGSAALPGRASIAGYARAIGAALLPAYGQQLHLLGFHTGCLVATELALQFPRHVGRLILIDVPCFDAARQAELRAELNPRDRASAGFQAAFSYACAAQFGKVRQRGVVIATKSGLSEPTRRAAALLRFMAFVDCPEITRPAFTTGKERIAELVDALLGS